MASIDDDDSLRQISNMVARLFLPTGVAWWVTGVKTAVYCYNPLAKHEYMYHVFNHHHLHIDYSLFVHFSSVDVYNIWQLQSFYWWLFIKRINIRSSNSDQQYICETVMTWEWSFVTWSAELGIGNQELGAASLIPPRPLLLLLPVSQRYRCYPPTALHWWP